MKTLLFAFSILASLAAGAVLTHGDDHQGTSAEKKAAQLVEEKEFGRPGDQKKVTRTIGVEMKDTMRYTPAEIIVRRGDTVRFRLHNRGRVMHEMVLGTAAALKEHAELMKKFPGMEHDEPHMLHVRPGQTGELVWQFTRPGEFPYGCLIPGHFEAGMVGKVVVR